MVPFPKRGDLPQSNKPMRWRRFISLSILLIGAIVASSSAGRAQLKSMPVIGFLNIGSPSSFARFVTAFHKGLSAGGYVEGSNVSIEYRWAEGNYDLLREQAANLVRLRVDLIVATGGLAAARAAKDATESIPILNIFGVNPVGEGLVASFSRPGGNITGVNAYASELIPKRLELLREVVPSIDKFAVLLNPKVPSARFERADVERVTATTKLALSIIEAGTESEIVSAFDLAAQRVGALVVSPDGFFTSRRNQIVALAARYRLPAIYAWREYVVANGLMSYGPSITDAYRQIGEYASRILKGAPPRDLPVQQPTTFELVVNLKTAKALGIEIPTPLFITGAEVIE
jgi:putative tryptophan/tyrosine transport system substrate-binding protein